MSTTYSSLRKRPNYPVLLLSSLAFCLLGLVGCNSEKGTVAELEQQAAPAKKIKKQTELNAIASTDWRSGWLPADDGATPSSSLIVNPDLLKPLTFSLTGSKIWKSNNPEIFTGDGWLMQNARTDAARGGTASPLSGTNAVYLFHINKSGTTKFIHILVSNPQPTAITVSAKGSLYTNAATSAPYSGAGTGQSYKVSKDWLVNTPNINVASTSLASGGMMQIASIQMSASNMVDGRFELTTSAGAYVYTVVTSNGDLGTAITRSQGAAAPGEMAYTSPSTFGREAGIYAQSKATGITDVALPSSTGHVGLCLNTTNKFNTNLQDQTAASVMTLNNGAPRSYGNYGHLYDVTLRISNTYTRSRTVRLYFASNATSASVGTTWNGALKLNGIVRDVFTTPSKPRQQLAEWIIPAGALFNANLYFYVPGLITTNQQLILETRN